MTQFYGQVVAGLIQRALVLYQVAQGSGLQYCESDGIPLTRSRARGARADSGPDRLRAGGRRSPPRRTPPFP
jgi:hypothetical protein